tara:strand:- start:644 stop:1273 length:630 start_codon:yes stop_codon:yes gene_type:complete
MRTNKAYLEASFVSFVIHGIIILYLLGFFYYESQQRTVLSNPINVNLVFEQEVKQKNTNRQVQENQIIREIQSSEPSIQPNITDRSISFDSLINSVSVEDLLKEDDLIFSESVQSQIEIYSALIIQTIQTAWRKPINIQDGLVCNLRLSINKNGRIINANLIKSSGNIRFDNSALKAVERVETFNFFNKIPLSIYASNFKNIVITFNPT